MAGNIFINYRRGDDPGFTQALLGRLEQAFAADQLFMDIEDIAPGLDFVEVLNEQVARCDVLIAMIGRGWIGAVDEDGKRRLDNPDDFVRIEIESALAQKKRVIPVLVNDAKMPRAAELPASLHPFARCNAVRLTHEHFRADAQALVGALKNVLAEADKARGAKEEQDRLDAKARADAEEARLKQERLYQVAKRREQNADPREKAKRPDGEVKPASQSGGIAGWIADLPSEISWYVPFGVVGVFMLGWLLPGTLFSMRFEWGLGSLAYGIAGLIGTGAALYMRREEMGGAELALYWYAAVSFLSVVMISVVHYAGLGASLNSDLIALAIAGLSLAALLLLRRKALDGLEGSVYWLGATMVGFWGLLPRVAYAYWTEAFGTGYWGMGAQKGGGLVLAVLILLSAAVILLWRRKSVSRPELAIYLMGTAASFVAMLFLL